jgi:methyl-accepting chemotaxis protein-2 (aspartate sensor receptor)
MDYRDAQILRSVPRARRWSVGAKLSLLQLTLIICALGAMTWAVDTTVTRLLTEHDFESRSRQTRELLDRVDAFERELRGEIGRLSALFIAQHTLPVASDDTHLVRSGNEEVPVFSAGGVVLNGNVEQVDRFAAATGGYATVFARRGQEFVRITTSLKKEDGTRAVGTRLDRSNPAYAAVLDGQTYTGKATLFGRDVMTMYRPIKDRAGRVIGIWFVGLDFQERLAALKGRILATKVGARGYTYVVDAKPGPSFGNFLVHSTLQGKSALDLKDDRTGRPYVLEMLQNKSGSDSYYFKNELRSVVYGTFETWNWLVVGANYASELGDELDRLRRWIVGFGILVTAILALALLVSVRRLVSKPLLEAVRVTREVAAGDLGCQIAIESNDEVGQLMRALSEMTRSLSGLVLRIQAAAGAINVASSELAAGNTDLAERTQRDAAQLEETAASMEQITATVKQNADNANDTNNLAHEAARVAGDGGRVMATLLETMNGVSASASQIAEIVSVIESVAFQTNVLALNAALEAARAGEHGRGFAVVASQVRTLARDCASAAAQIKQVIVGSVEKIGAGAALVSDAADKMMEIRRAVERVQSVAQQIAGASNEQRLGVETANTALTAIDRSTQHNAALVEQAAATATSMQNQAEQLTQAVAAFRAADGAAATPSSRSAGRRAPVTRPADDGERASRSHRRAVERHRAAV